ncbi:MAG: hypothetical protein NVS4B3_11260 [Gemmatimonadaceae bacterium]
MLHDNEHLQVLEIQRPAIRGQRQGAAKAFSNDGADIYSLDRRIKVSQRESARRGNGGRQ